MTTLTNVLPQPLNSTTSRYTSSRFNPLEMQTMKNLDVEKLEEDLEKVYFKLVQVNAINKRRTQK